MRAMARGPIARVEELTRIPSDVQDALITILSEKTLPIPELGQEVQARPGFNVIATANDRDRGVNELSSRAAAPVQHRRPAGAATARRRRSASSRAGSPARPLAGAARGARRRSRRSAAWSRCSGSCAPA